MQNNRCIMELTLYVSNFFIYFHLLLVIFIEEGLGVVNPFFFRMISSGIIYANSE